MGAAVADDYRLKAFPADDAERTPAPRRRLAGDADGMTHHCEEFSRSSLLLRAAAEAGRGLPAIEPGMPAPAGTVSTAAIRLTSGGTALTVYGAAALGARGLDEGIARAAAIAGRNMRVLVSIFAPGAGTRSAPLPERRSPLSQVYARSWP